MGKLVSNEDIKKKLKDKGEGGDSDGTYCPECGAKNPSNSIYCQECGSSLTSPTVKKDTEKIPPKTYESVKNNSVLGKIPGFRSGTGWKMILGSIGYILIIVLIVFGLLVALINTSVSTSVNSAIYTDNIAGNNINSTDDDRFLVLDVSVKNDGKDKVTINPSDFIISTSNGTTESQTFIGNTSIESVEINPGESKNMVIAFTVPDDITPKTLKYVSFWDPGSEGSNATIGTIVDAEYSEPFDGQYSFYNVNMDYTWSGGSQKVVETYNVSYNYLNQSFTRDSLFSGIFTTYTYDENGTLTSSDSSLSNSSLDTTTFNQSLKETSTTNLISPSDSTFFVSSSVYITLTTGTDTVILGPDMRDEDGIYMSSVMKNPYLSYINSDVPVVDDGETIGYKTLTGSEVIEVMGKKIDCWVVKDNESGEAYTFYYDKTTGLLLKMAGTSTDSSYGVTTTEKFEMIINSTNVPLIGVKT